MSYCRWSSDDFRCDIYAYESDRGFEVHVAGFRIPDDAPRVTASLISDPVGWTEQFGALTDYVRRCLRTTITLPHAGATFTEPTLEAFRARLVELRLLGYRFPDQVLSDIDAEIAQRDAGGKA